MKSQIKPKKEPISIKKPKYWIVTVNRRPERSGIHQSALLAALIATLYHSKIFRLTHKFIYGILIKN